MYAVIESDGKQYRVELGDVIHVATRDAEPGASISFDHVLLVADDEDRKIGTPHVENCAVTAEVVEHGREKKVEIIKFKRRKHHMKRQGHRQDYTAVKITAIGDKKLAVEKKED
ncbi:MAG: 50S ribosomal protein L21 [Gammaproteobacteria bacterium]|nr:50S ribosomal protein L21 [Gammaproteobacteria bacterium]